jgi:hypothetical protein
MSRTALGSTSSRTLKVSPTLAEERQVQAASTRTRRAWRLPAGLRPLRSTASPVEVSAGARPRNDISWRGVSNRRTSPISAAKVTATQKRGAAHRLVSLNYRRHRPVRHDLGQLLLQAVQRLRRIRNRVDGLLEDNLLRGMIEALLGQPAPVHQCPMTAAAVNPAMPQWKREQLLALAAQIVGRRLVGPNQIAHRLVKCVRHPHPGQLAGPMPPCRCCSLKNRQIECYQRWVRSNNDYFCGVPMPPRALCGAFGWPQFPRLNVVWSVDGALDGVKQAEGPRASRSIRVGQRTTSATISTCKQHKKHTLLR